MKTSAVLTLLLSRAKVAWAAVDRFEVKYASPISYQNDVAWLTSQNDCSVQVRSVADGSVIWTQDVCNGVFDKHETVVIGDGVYTLNQGKLRSWEVGAGMKWEVDVPAELNKPGDEDPFVADQPRLFSAETSSNTILGVVVSKGKKEGLALINATTGKIVHSKSGTAAISARKLLNEAKRKPIKYAKVIGLVSSGDRMGVVTAYTDDTYLKTSSLAYSEIGITTSEETPTYEVTNTVSLRTVEATPSEIQHKNSLKTWADKSQVYLLGFKQYSSRAGLASFDMDKGSGDVKDIGMGSLYYEMLWFDDITIDGLTDKGRVVRLAGQDGRLPKEYRTESLVIVGQDDNGDLMWKKFGHKNEDDDVQTEALVYCPDMNVVISVDSEKDGTTVISSYETSKDHVTWSNGNIEGVSVLISNAGDGTSRGLPNYAHLVKCNADSLTAVITAKGGIAVGLRVDKHDSSLVATKLWSTEEDVGKKTLGSDEL